MTDRTTLRNRLKAARETIDLLGPRHREAMARDCVSLPGDWFWRWVGPEMVTAERSDSRVYLTMFASSTTIQLHVKEHGLGSIPLDQRLIDAMREQLAREQAES